MQRGTVRRRSISDTGDSAQRPSQRHRTSDTRPHSPSPLSSSFITTVSTESALHTMGPPVSTNGTSNGVSGTSPPAATDNGGPFNLPPSVLDQVEPYHPRGNLAYPDDKEWIVNPDAEFMTDDMVANDTNASRAKAIQRKQTFGRRMPIDREELVRLMLQGLHDMGYQYVAFAPSPADAEAKQAKFSPRSPATRLRRALQGTLKLRSWEGGGRKPTPFFLRWASRLSRRPRPPSLNLVRRATAWHRARRRPHPTSTLRIAQSSSLRDRSTSSSSRPVNRRRRLAC